MNRTVTGNTDMMTLNEVAYYLRINRYTVIRLMKEGQIRGTKIGKCYRFLREDVENLFNQNQGV